MLKSLTGEVQVSLRPGAEKKKKRTAILVQQSRFIDLGCQESDEGEVAKRESLRPRLDLQLLQCHGHNAFPLPQFVDMQL